MIRKTKIFWRFILLTLINSLLSVILQHFFCKISFSIVKRNSTMSTLYISLTCIMRCWYPKQFKGKHCLSQPLYLLILIRYYSQHLYILSISTNLTWDILNMFEYFLQIISLGVVILSFFVSNFVQNICPRCPIRLKDN